MYDEYEIDIEAELSPGPALRSAWALVAGWLALGGLLAPLPAWRLPLLLLVPAWLLLLARRPARRWRRLYWHGAGTPVLLDAEGVRHAGELAGTQFVSPWLVVLRVRAARRVWALPLLRRDRPEAVRRLNQRLRAGSWRRALPDTDHT